MKYIDLKNIEYKEAWDFQVQLFQQVIAEKLKANETNNSLKTEVEDYLILCEHPHVYTLGKSGEQNHLLVNDNFLKTINASYYETDRGGDITYHGYGQLVGYPILDLEKYGLRMRTYIEQMEDAIILTLAEYGIKSERLEYATGVWLDAGIAEKERKICAIGVKASRFVTMHGFALNVNTDLSYFNHINACGLDKGVTSMQKELGYKLDFEEVKSKFQSNFFKLFTVKSN
jgi:lipoyl(octanoyl) transferase